MSTWRSYDKATAEDAYLDPLFICTECGGRKDEAFKACERCGNKAAERFVFPASVPMDFGIQYAAEVEKHKQQAKDEGRDYEGFPITDLLPLLSELLGAKRLERLQKLEREVGQTGNLVWGVFNSLLIAYGLAEERQEDDDPLGQGEKTKDSSKPSSATSESSRRTSPASSTSKASTENESVEAGAGSSVA